MRFNIRPTMLIILDGFGIGKNYSGNSAYLANTSTIDMLNREYPKTKLEASGEAVGLPEGQMGNSEVGHLNIGSGRVVYQELTKINRAIKTGEFYENEEFLKAIDNVKKNNSSLHLMGLVSKGGVHSHLDHLFSIVKLAKEKEVKKLFIHVILDGRDVSPDSGIKDVKELEDKLKEIGLGKIATISGRYYAMDRDKRWDRTSLYYNLVTEGIGEEFDNTNDLIKSNYDREITDEFVNPGIVKDCKSDGLLKDNDSLIFFNFRPDRARQIVRALSDEKFIEFERKVRAKLYIVTMTQYDKTILGPHVAFKNEAPINTLGEVLALNGKKQLRIAETEKYAHVTFFFNGGREAQFLGEDRALIPSPKVATYDLKPEMSAREVTEELIKRIDSNKYDCIILNFANPDMVGHTGNIPAAIKAIETVDECLGKILNKLDEVGGAALITADHGNCEVMLTDDNKPVTSHTTNLVPLYLYSKDLKDVELLDGGALCDLSPTILDLLNIAQPKEMTGKSLIKNTEK